MSELSLAEDDPGPVGSRQLEPEKCHMARKLLHQAVAIVTGIVLMVGMFFGLGLWRRSQDSRWCEHATAGGVVGGGEPATSQLLSQLRSACTLHRERQRVIFGAVWRRGGPDTARCGFELARLQLISGRRTAAYGALLERYGFGGSAFEVSNRDDQDRFVKACLAQSRSEG
jgi:hypothetical protein